jgi:hypothetical protein
MVTERVALSHSVNSAADFLAVEGLLRLAREHVPQHVLEDGSKNELLRFDPIDPFFEAAIHFNSPAGLDNRRVAEAEVRCNAASAEGRA